MDKIFFYFQPTDLTAERKEIIRRKLEAKMFAARKKAEGEVVISFPNKPENNPWFISSFL